MSFLPKRPTTYLLLLLLAILGVLTFWLQKALTDPAIRKAAENTRAARESKAQPEPLPAPLPIVPATPPPANPDTDAAILEMHREMTNPDTPPERELEIIQELVSLQQRAGGATIGDNGDVTLALVGNSEKGVWLPRSSSRIRDGLLQDRWGSPYWFHPNAVNQIEIRSPGPDKELFTSDDLILNGSPAGFGATPAGNPE